MVVKAGPRAWASNLAAGRIAAIRPKEDWQARRRARGDGTYDTRLRYVGKR